MGMTSHYLPKLHRQRAEKLELLYLLYSGQHEEYFIARSHSRYNFRPVGSESRPFYAPFDLLSLISRKTADLLVGEPPRIGSPLSTLRDRIARIVEDSALHAGLVEVAIDCSWAGEAFVEIVREQGRTLIQHLPAREIFPVGSIGADGQATRYVRYAVDTAWIDSSGQVVDGTSGKPSREIRLLLVTTYSPGTIENACREIGPDNTIIRSRPLSDWPGKSESGQPLPERIETGMAAVSIVRFRNSAAGDTDYTPQLIALQDTLSAKNTQLARVVMKHADPKIYFATSAANADGQINHEDDAIFGDTPEAMPKYITWEAQLPAAVEDRKFALLALATVAEMPLSVLGVKDDAAAESAAKMRLMAINAIAKVQRKAAYLVQSLRLAIVRALNADGLRSMASGEVTIQTRDGIPDDERERADQIATLRSAGVMSLRRALAMQQLDEAEVEAELQALTDEAAKTTPDVLFDEETNGATPRPQDAGQDASETAADAAKG